MAKQKTGGLGRGLDALLSITYEEAGDAQVNPSKEEHTPKAQESPRTVIVLNADEEAELAAAARIDQSEHPAFEEEKPTKNTMPTYDAPRPQKRTVPQSQKIAHHEAMKPANAQPEMSNPVEPDENIPNPAPKPETITIIEQVGDKESDIVSIDSIEPNPDQPRINFKKEELEELAASISSDGLLQPILVRPMNDGRFQIIAGERRWQACKMAGLDKIPVRIKKADDNEAHVLALVENIQRSDLNPIEEAYGYRRMIEQGMTQAEVAQQVSKGRSTVANALRLLDLPEDAQQLLFEEKITAGHARAILSVPTPEGRQKLTEKIIKENLSVRQVESIARLLSAKPGEKREPKAPAPKSFKMVARDLKSRLQSPVKVKTVGGKNKIEIEFKDEEDLTRIFELLTEGQKSAE